MDLNRIAVFARVVETGSFTAAAKALGIPKSSVSRAVAALESDLDVRLLQRTTRAVHLTDAGVAYHAQVSQALLGIEEATAAVSDLQRGIRGGVRLTAPADVGVWLLPDPLTRFRSLHPDVSIELVLTNRVVSLVEEGFDFALRAGKLNDSSLVARAVGPVHGALFASPSYVASRGAPTRVADLSKHDCVLFRAKSWKQTLSLQGPKGEQKVEVTGSVSADDFGVIREMTLAGWGIGLLPAFLAVPSLKAGELLRILPRHVADGNRLSLVYPSARYVPQRVAVLRDFLLKDLGERLGSACATPSGSATARPLDPR